MKYGALAKEFKGKSSGFRFSSDPGEIKKGEILGLVGKNALGKSPFVKTYELCGGTHLERTSDVGLFLIVSDGSAAAGVRRIEALTGRGAYALTRRRFDILEGLATALRASPDEMSTKIAPLEAELAAARRQLADLHKQQALRVFETELARVQDVEGAKVLALEVPHAEVDTLRALGDRFRERYPRNGAAILGSGTVLISVVADDLLKRGLTASDLIAGIGGRGGGRPNLAQGSLPDTSRLAEALSKATTSGGGPRQTLDLTVLEIDCADEAR